MTRKDYVIIAAAIKASASEAAKAADLHMKDSSARGASDAITIVTKNIAKVLKDDNPLFDVARFTTACK